MKDNYQPLETSQILDSTPRKVTDLSKRDLVKGHKVVPLASVESKVTVPAYDLSVPSSCWNLDKDPS